MALARQRSREETVDSDEGSRKPGKGRKGHKKPRRSPRKSRAKPRRKEPAPTRKREKAKKQRPSRRTKKHGKKTKKHKEARRKTRRKPKETRKRGTKGRDRRRRRRRHESSDEDSSERDSSSPSDSSSSDMPGLTSSSSSSDSSSLSESNSDSESTDVEYAAYRRAKHRRRHRRHTRRAGVVYNGDDLEGVDAPKLRHGDEKARKTFRVDYITYVAEHENRMRSRPSEYRILPKAVVECIDADLLVYICNYELADRYKTKDTAKVSALAVHQWVMQQTPDDLAMEDDEGIRKLKSLKVELTGEGGVRSVQNLFTPRRRGSFNG